MKKIALLLIFGSACLLQAAGLTVIRINQIGYLPRSMKVAVLMTSDSTLRVRSFQLRDALTDAVVLTSRSVRSSGSWGGKLGTFRIDFSEFRKRGGYYIEAGGARSSSFRVDDDVYFGVADFLLNYMRQQRSGYNPFLRDSCHTRDGYIIYHPSLDSTYMNVSGGWHDASDYLQYVTTSATAVYQMLFAYQQHPTVFGDQFNASGQPMPNGIPDIVDEAKWGLDWLVKMNPQPEMMFNQIADDRDHLGFRLPTQDTVSYGRGRQRPVYFCTGKPQGILKYKNRTTGIASTAGKFASAFALGSKVLESFYPQFAGTLQQRAKDAYTFGAANPGACQTAPCRAPYFYEEENWTDDLQLAAATLFNTTGDRPYHHSAAEFGTQEGVTRWMGADSAHHYQWYPFVNLGHYLLANSQDGLVSPEFKRILRAGIDRVFQRGRSNPFLFGVPFIWCSNNYVSATLTQLQLYQSLTRDGTYAAMEASLRDWLFGCNPWGTSMIVGFPKGGVSPKDPHSAFTHLYRHPIDGGLVDGPVRGSIFASLKGVSLSHPDPFAAYQSAEAVYHDDWADYSTNEPTMDGTAGLTYYFASLEAQGRKPLVYLRQRIELGGITRMDTTRKEIRLVFTGHEFAEGGEIILLTLRKHGIKASFFFTGDFYRNPEFRKLIHLLKKDGHYLGAHSDKHLLYCSWRSRDSLLVSHDEFLSDVKGNYEAMRGSGLALAHATYFLPPFEWYNQAISEWTRQLGLTLVNFTPGTYSNADYTTPDMPNYVSSDSIVARILGHESSHGDGLNGFILLSHIGTDPKRSDKFYLKLDPLIAILKLRGYRFVRF